MRFVALAALAAAASFTTSAAAEQGDWLVRLRGIIVAPNEDAGAVMPTFPTGSVNVGNSVVPELDFTYFLTNNIGAELILGTSHHNINGAGALEGLGKIADVMALPPTLTLQYHFFPDAKMRPYVGAGVNWTLFYNDDASAALVDAIGATDVRLSDSVGYAFQAGMDIDITEKVFVNFDIKYIDMNTKATLDTSGLINTVDVDLNPIVAGVGIGMRF